MFGMDILLRRILLPIERRLGRTLMSRLRLFIVRKVSLGLSFRIVAFWISC